MDYFAKIKIGDKLSCTDFMGQKYKYIIYILVALCPMYTVAQKKMTTEEYINKFKHIAVEEKFRSGIPASITLAQGILESGSGNSRLTQEGNNHFGIKCKGSWTGKTILEDDDEKQECFRAYDSAWQSYHDHSDFLLHNSRYGTLFNLDATDYKSWAYGLKAAGYATNPVYPQKLIEYIEKYNLHQYDLLQPNAAEKEEIKQEWKAEISNYIEINETPALITKEGDTWQMIANANDMRVWQITKYNDLSDSEACHARDTIYLKPKRRHATTDFHTVKSGQTMRSISKIYAVKLSKLYERNLMQLGEEPAAGEKIYLNDERKVKPNLYNKPSKQKNIEPIKKDSIIKTKIEEKKDSIIKSPNYKEPEKSKDTTNKNVHIIKEEVKIINQKEVTKTKDTFSSIISNIHIVKEKETLYGIAKKYNITVDELKHLNGLDSNNIKVGQELRIKPIVKKSIPQVDPIKTPPKKDPVKTLPKKPTSYTAKKGDKIGMVAKKFHLDKPKLMKLNNLKVEKLKEGQKVKLY